MAKVTVTVDFTFDTDEYLSGNPETDARDKSDETLHAMTLMEAMLYGETDVTDDHEIHGVHFWKSENEY